MKKKNKKIIIGSIIAVILIVLFFRLNLFTVFYGNQEMSCTFINPQLGEISCTTGGNNILPAISGGYSLTFSSTFVRDNYQSFITSLQSSSNTNLKEFLNTHNFAGYSGGYYNFDTTVEASKCNGITSCFDSEFQKYLSQGVIRGKGKTNGCTGFQASDSTDTRTRCFANDELVIKNYPNQLLIVSGTLRDKESTATPTKEIPFKTYAICDFSTPSYPQCKLKDLVVDGWKSNEMFATIESMTMTLKEGGYSETENLCVENGLERCEGQEVLTCNNMNWENKGKIDGKCGYINPTAETCFDNIKNQDETEIDCGGSCKSCTFVDTSGYNLVDGFCTSVTENAQYKDKESCESNMVNPQEGLSSGIIIAIIVGGVLILSAIGYAIFLVRRK